MVPLEGRILSHHGDIKVEFYIRIFYGFSNEDFYNFRILLLEFIMI